MLAGAWVLAMIPLFQVLRQLGVAYPLPALPGLRHAIETFDDTYLAMVDPLPTFCIGAVLLFSRERGRRDGRLDWTRRWGVVSSYLMVLLGVIGFGPVTALVAVGIAALFYSLPIQYQPAIGPVLANAGAAYIYYVPFGTDAAYFVLGATSAAVMLLACVPLYDALRSSGPRWLAIALLTPLGAAAAVQVFVAVASCFISGPTPWFDAPLFAQFFFKPAVVAALVARDSPPWLAPRLPADLGAYEFVKWLVCLLAAVWLTTAQLAALRSRRPRGGASESP